MIREEGGEGEKEVGRRKGRRYEVFLGLEADLDHLKRHDRN